MGATIRHKMCQLVISFQIIILLKKKKKNLISKSIKTFRVGLTDRVGRVTGNEQLFLSGLIVKEHNYSVSKDQCNYNGWSDGQVIKRRSKVESSITSISYC